jgi:hypothetical protein
MSSCDPSASFAGPLLGIAWFFDLAFESAFTTILIFAFL